jgi:hypothetical protein
LTKFLKCESAQTLTTNETALARWTAALGVSPAQAVKELETKSLLVRPTLSERLESGKSLQQLKEMCRKHGLKLTGKKSDLSARLIEFGIPENAIPLGDGYICSATGRDAAETYKERRAAEKLKVQLKTADLLDAHDFEGAVKAVCEYEASQVFQRGIGVDWSSGTVGLKDVRGIYSAKKRFMSKVSAEDLANIRLIAALDRLWGEEVQIIPDRTAVIRGCKYNIGIAARQLQFHHSAIPGVDNLRDFALPFEVEYMAPPDECAACLARNGKRYSIDEIPELPSDDCTCENGCRCSYSVAFKDLDD